MTRSRPNTTFAALLGAFFLAGTIAASGGSHAANGAARAGTRTVWDSVYTLDQAARGETSYAKTCARCHKASLAGADESPPLVGSAFLAAWNDQSLGGLHERIRGSMPSDDPGTYSRELVTDVIAYVLKMNGFPAGAVELPTDVGVLKEIVIRSAKP